MARPFRSVSLTCAALLATAVLAQPLLAQDKPKAAAPPPASKTDSKPAPAKSTKKASPAPTIPDGTALSILIRKMLLTLNDANLSGNYTVLRDLAAPSFQSANDPAKLTGIFAKLREAKIDMAPIVYFDPKLVRQPQINENGMLRLSGFLPTRPQQINFDLLFQHVADRWRLFGIAVNTSLAKAAAAQPAPAAANGAGKEDAAKPTKKK